MSLAYSALVVHVRQRRPSHGWHGGAAPSGTGNRRKEGCLMATLKAFATKFSNDWSMNLVSMLTYSLITTIFPLLLGILTIAGVVLKRLPGNSFNQLVTSINNALPSNFHQVVNVHNLLNNLVAITGPLAVVSLVGLLWAGSNLFTSMENAFSIILRVPDRDFIPQRLMGIGMLLIMTFLLPLSLAASSLVTAGSAAFASVLPPPLGVALSVVGPLTSLGILWLLFLAFYIIVPNTKVPFGDAWRGALAAAVLFGLLQLLFPLYFKFFLNGNAKYGAVAASALVLIAWLWFLALITIIGAQINAVAMGTAPLPRDVPRTIAQDYQHTVSRQNPAVQGPRSPKRGRVATSGRRRIHAPSANVLRES